MNAIVDQIRDGSTYRISLQIDPNTWQIITFSLSGIKSPACRRDVPNMEDLVEPFGEEAKYFAETRILHREVKIILESNNNNTFIGTLLHPSGNIAEALLSEGFARVVDWSVTVVTGGPEKLRAAEQKAKISKIRIWREFVAKKAISNGKVSEFDGKVVKIINSDLIAVLCNGIERKISFSSLKAPKLNPKDTTLNRDSHFNAEAREFLRSRLIGKIVHVKVFYINTKIDFVKLPTEGFTDERECATVTFNDTNIAESMISKGLATVIRHKKDDDDRSSQYDLLLVAEVNAIAQLKGLHNPVDPVMVRVNDASESLMKAKQFLPWLQKSKKIGCIVDFCASGGRFKVFYPNLDSYTFSKLQIHFYFEWSQGC